MHGSVGLQYVLVDVKLQYSEVFYAEKQVKYLGGFQALLTDSVMKS